MTEVLFIAFQFPPINIAGSIRPYMFAKYLPSFGIKPIILTLDPYNQKDYKVDSNNKLIDQLTSEIKVYTAPIKKKNTSSIEKFNQIYLSIGDDKYKRWKKNALIQIEEILKKNNIKAIYFTAPPFNNGNLAVKTSKKYKIPLILDMRDGWSKWCIAPYASVLHYHFTKKREAFFFKNSTYIVTVTNVLKNVFLATHSNLESNKIEVIPNGFDINDDEIPTLLSSNVTSTSKKIKIGYIGTFYYNPSAEESLNSSWWQRKSYRWFQYFPTHEKWVYRSPFFFLKTVAELIKEHPNYKSKIEFIFIGNIEPWLLKMVNDLGLTSNFENRGFIEHIHLEEVTKDINFFLSTSVKVEEGKDYAIASKTFDYIKFKKPILAFVTAGSQKSFIENSNTGITFDPDDLKTNTRKLKNILEHECSLNVNKNYLKGFTRKNITKQLSELIYKAI